MATECLLILLYVRSMFNETHRFQVPGSWASTNLQKHMKLWLRGAESTKEPKSRNCLTSEGLALGLTRRMFMNNCWWTLFMISHPNTNTNMFMNYENVLDMLGYASTCWQIRIWLDMISLYSTYNKLVYDLTWFACTVPIKNPYLMGHDLLEGNVDWPYLVNPPAPNS